MPGWVVPTITAIGAVLACSGFWSYLIKRLERRITKVKKNELETKVLVGLGHDRIVYLGKAYIRRGYITSDEYENLVEYLYKPYKEIGGNGSAKRIMQEVEKLPIRG